MTGKQTNCPDFKLGVIFHETAREYKPTHLLGHCPSNHPQPQAPQHHPFRPFLRPPTCTNPSRNRHPRLPLPLPTPSSSAPSPPPLPQHHHPPHEHLLSLSHTRKPKNHTILPIPGLANRPRQNALPPHPLRAHQRRRGLRRHRALDHEPSHTPPGAAGL